MQLKEEARAAAKAFENEAKAVKAQLYEDFSQQVSEDKSLYKFWQLYASMNRAKKQKGEMQDFRREDDQCSGSELTKKRALLSLKGILNKRTRKMQTSGGSYSTAYKQDTGPI